jgi:succinate dehydrogenase / fumarate reductase iron-sulfur subunit
LQVALKIWRYDSSKGERALKDYEIDAPEEATLLDCLDIVKDRHDGSLAYRKSCRMMICGSCGMRMDGAAVLACKTRMYDIAQDGRIPVISAMGNLPIVKDLVVDMDPFWAKFRAMKPYLQPGYDRPEDGREYRISQERMNVVHKEALCINCGCCVSECNAMESDPEFLGPQALAKGMRFVGDPRDAATVERLEQYSGPHGIWECTRCFFCNERCPKGVDPRDAIAKLGAEAIHHGIDRDMGAKHAKWFIRSTETTGWLRETELVPKTQGIVSSVKQMKFAMGLIKHNKAGLAFPPLVARDVSEARNLRKIVQGQDRPGALGHVQGERALARRAPGHVGEESLEQIYERQGAFARPYLPGVEAPADEPPATGGDTAAPSVPPGEGSAGGQGSLTQADVTPGREPTKKPGGGA